VTASAWPYPRHIAHRGAGRLAPENTMVAFRTGWQHGYRMFEFDAKLTADGKVVLMHDDTLERTTDGVGPIATRTWEEVMLLDAGYWHSAAMAGERVPDLDRVADWLVERGGFANVEIKPCRGRDVETGVAVALAATRCWADVAPPPLLSSFSPEALAAARMSAPDLPRGLLFGRPPADCIEQALALECVSLHVDWRAVDAALVQAAHGAGLRLLCYTVNDPAEVARLRELGVDGLITDSVDRIEPID
jgi:glycerophosphoryl diester phosphodiesterase